MKSNLTFQSAPKSGVSKKLLNTPTLPWHLKVGRDQILDIIEQVIGIYALKSSDYFESQLSRAQQKSNRTYTLKI